MFDELIGVSTVEDLERLSVRLLDDEVFRQLQEEMAAQDTAFSRADYWPEDIVARKTASATSMKKAVAEVCDTETGAPKALHILQMIMATAPGATAGIQRFLKRVTFG